MLAFFLLPMISDVAWGQTHPSYQSLWESVANDSDCAPSQYPDFILVTCKKALALWYFTKSNHSAHPGVIKREVVQDGNVVSSRVRGWSFASDSAPPAFKAWLAQIQDLDRQAKEYLDKTRRPSGGTNSN